jgi:CRP-like cAMP-binding protein/Fe-S-cluster-containing hydrogenase component 2
VIAASPSSIERLQQVPLLRDLPADVLGKLQPNLYECEFAKDEVILREGEYCDGAYYLIDGLVEVRFGRSAEQTPRTFPEPTARNAAGWPAKLKWFGKNRPEAGPAAVNSGATVILPEIPVEIRAGARAVLERGDIFGEGSALSRYPIATDIVSVASSKCLLIRTPALRQMLDMPELASFKALFDDRYRQRSLRAHFSRIELFKDLPDTIINDLIETVDLVSYKPGRVIVEQGAKADALFLVRGGYVKVGVKVGAGELAVTYLRKGDYVGESALLLDEPWPFALSALEHVEVVKLPRERVQQVLARAPEVEARLWRTLTARLKQVRQSAKDPVKAQPLQFAMDSGLIHGDSVLLINLETCTRCDECVRACADVHDGTPRFIREGTKFRNFSVPTACYHCSDPVCMIGCPTGAITRPLGTLEVTIDKATCIGCGNCVRRCPWGNIHQMAYDSPTVGEKINLAMKCDLCVGRDAGPACVQMCPHGAAVRVSFKQQDLIDTLFSR